MSLKPRRGARRRAAAALSKYKSNMTNRNTETVCIIKTFFAYFSQNVKILLTK